jgi:Trk K+ transport system NAD-binding subunit
LGCGDENAYPLFVLAVKRAGTTAIEEITPVPGDHTFLPGDRVVLLGSKAALSLVDV